MSNNIADISTDKHPVANKFLVYLGSFMMVFSLIALLVFSLLDKFELSFLGYFLLGAGDLLIGLKNRSPEKYGSGKMLTALMVSAMLIGLLVVSYGLFTKFSK
jgi:hypothetical protein